MLFIGRYYHALEQKGRLSIPSKFRKDLGERPILTQGLDGCLFLYPEVEWQKIITDAQKLPFTKKHARDWVRLLANNAVELALDRIGRIKVPDYLIEYANLQKDVVIAGSFSHLEIWDRDVYHAYFEKIQDKAEEIAEQVSIGQENEN